MLSDYPIYFDDVKLFTPESWEESYAVVESIRPRQERIRSLSPGMTSCPSLPLFHVRADGQRGSRSFEIKIRYR
jgi:hypothetical protein